MNTTVIRKRLREREREIVRERKKNTRVNEKPLRSVPFRDEKQESV